MTRNSGDRATFVSYTETVAVRLANPAEASGPVVTGSRDLVLSAEETDLLAHVLDSYLSDLRMEIVGTDNPALRRDLRHEEETLKALLPRLA